MFYLSSTSAVTVFLLAALLAGSPMIVTGAVSDEELMELHSHILSEEEMIYLHRELGYRDAWNTFRDSMSTTLRGGGRRYGGGHGGGNDSSGGMGGMSSDEMEIVHYLLDNRFDIDRYKERLMENGRVVGMELTTTSDNPAVASKIKAHVRQMVDVVEEGRWVRRRDPLYEALLSHRDEISLDVDYLNDGVAVTERGDTACTAALIEGHSQAVDGFIAKGRSEVRANHQVPSVCRD